MPYVDLNLRSWMEAQKRKNEEISATSSIEQTQPSTREGNEFPPEWATMSPKEQAEWIMRQTDHGI